LALGNKLRRSAVELLLNGGIRCLMVGFGTRWWNSALGNKLRRSAVDFDGIRRLMVEFGTW